MAKSKYKPSDLNYVITIKLDGETEQGGTSSSSTPGSPTKTLSAPAKTSVWKMLGQSTMVQTGKNFINQTISFKTSNVGLVTGNSASQERIDLIMNGGKFLLSAGAVVATGNPALILSFALAKSMDVAMRQRQIDLNYSIERESLNLSRQRAGIAFNRSRLTGNT